MVNFGRMQVQRVTCTEFLWLNVHVGVSLGRNHDFKAGLGDWKSLKAQKGNLNY